MTNFDILSITFSALALIVSATVAQRQLGASRNSDSTLVLIELLKEFRSPEMLSDRARIIRELDSGRFDPSGGFRGLPDDMRMSVERVSHFFDQVGLLIAHDLAPADALISFFGIGAMQYWQRLHDYLISERRLRDPAKYQEYFEIFVNLCDRRDPVKLLTHIQRRMSSRGRLIDALRLTASHLDLRLRRKMRSLAKVAVADATSGSARAAKPVPSRAPDEVSPGDQTS
jgi:hypothetical protein